MAARLRQQQLAILLPGDQMAALVALAALGEECLLGNSNEDFDAVADMANRAVTHLGEGGIAKVLEAMKSIAQSAYRAIH